MITLLEYKLDLLKLEIETINGAILNKDDSSRQLKTWAISLWTAATTLTGVEHFKNIEDRGFIVEFFGENIPATSVWALSTLIIPAAFLILEVYHRRIQREFIWRSRKIHVFLNNRSASITKAFEKGDIEDFRIYDPAGENWRREMGGTESTEFDQFVGFWTVIRIPGVYVLYTSLTVLSIVLAVTGIWINSPA